MTLNSFQRDSLAMLKSIGIDAQPIGNWLLVDGSAIMSESGVADIVARSRHAGILGTVKGIKGGVVTLT
jgi:hypothetical protein